MNEDSYTREFANAMDDQVSEFGGNFMAAPEKIDDSELKASLVDSVNQFEAEDERIHYFNAASDLFEQQNEQEYGITDETGNILRESAPRK